MDNREIRFKAVLDDPEFMKRFDNTMNDVMIKNSTAMEAQEISEKLEKKENFKHHLRNAAGIGIGGTAFVALASVALVPLVTVGATVAAAPVIAPLALAIGFGAWFMKTINNFKKQDDLSIDKEPTKNKEYASYVADKTKNQIDEVNNAIREYRDIRESWNNGALENTLQNKVLVLAKIKNMNDVMKNFTNNLENTAHDNENYVVSAIVRDANNLLSKNALQKKIEKMQENSQSPSFKSKHSM